jgi:leucyl-tRNA synthetase
MSDDEVQKIALADQRIQEIIGKSEIRKVLVVKGKLVNIVVGNS